MKAVGALDYPQVRAFGLREFLQDKLLKISFAHYPLRVICTATRRVLDLDVAGLLGTLKAHRVILILQFDSAVAQDCCCMIMGDCWPSSHDLALNQQYKHFGFRITSCSN